MAASMLKVLGSNRILRLCRISDFYRTFLSESYRCDQLWKERLTSPYLQKINAKTFGIELLDSFNEEKSFNMVDIDLFINKLQELPSDFRYIAKEILYRFRHCESSVPIQDSIMHATVRGFLETGETDSLIEMITDKSKFGIFPDEHTMCMLLDHFATSKEYKVAAQLAYEVMLQEEYDHPIRNLLSLDAAIKHFIHTMDLERVEPEPIDEDEEIDYIAIKVIRNPYYDDHFDIKDERFLMGKTLYYLSKNTEALDGVFSRSLQLIGLGLYEKFEFANQLLADWVSDPNVEHVVYTEALQWYDTFLSTAPTRDPDAEEISMGEKRMDDVIQLLKLTPVEKATCMTRLKKLTSSLDQERSPSGNIEQKMEGYLWSQQFTKYETEDIKKLKIRYRQWMSDRDMNVQSYIKIKAIEQKKEEIHTKLNMLQEREELLTYFENIDDIDFELQYRKEEVIVEEEKEEYVAAPGERNVKIGMKKRK